MIVGILKSPRIRTVVTLILGLLKTQPRPTATKSLLTLTPPFPATTCFCRVHHCVLEMAHKPSWLDLNYPQPALKLKLFVPPYQGVSVILIDASGLAVSAFRNCVKFASIGEKS